MRNDHMPSNRFQAFAGESSREKQNEPLDCTLY